MSTTIIGSELNKQLLRYGPNKAKELVIGKETLQALQLCLQETPKRIEPLLLEISGKKVVVLFTHKIRVGYSEGVVALNVVTGPVECVDQFELPITAYNVIDIAGIVTMNLTLGKCEMEYYLSNGLEPDDFKEFYVASNPTRNPQSLDIEPNSHVQYVGCVDGESVNDPEKFLMFFEVVEPENI